MKAITTILLTVCFFIITFSQPNQNNIFLVKIESKDYKSLVKLDYSSGKETIIYNVQDYDYLIDASISPNGKYISIIEKKKGEIVLNEERNVGEYGKLPTQNMVIINVHGDVVMDLNKDVRRYVWNKKGDKIAFITGTYMEDAEYGFAPESVYIYDIIQDNLIQVQVNNAYKIHWLNTNNENALYLLCPARNPEEFVVKYDIDKKKVMTSLGVKSIHFSPDGKYYYSTPIETSNNGECNGGGN